MSSVLFAPAAAIAQEPGESIVDEIVVRGRNIPEPQRATSQVATFLSAEDLKRTGDDNAALALQRLSGLSIVGGRFAYVRGLGDRYSAARLNGTPLPSPEPLRRTVPFDLFPANILDGAVVQKSFSPNYPGEFGGGIIDLRTLRQPAESFLNVKAGIGLNLETTGRDGIYVRGGERDWLGFDDGLRKIPAPMQALLDSGVSLNSLTPFEIEQVGESLVNSPLSVIQNGVLGPNFEAAIDGGTSVDLGGATLGLVGVVGFDQKWVTKRATRQFVQADILGTDLESIETSLNTTVNALATVSLGWSDSEIQATGLYIHAGAKEAQIDTGRDFNAPGSTGQILDESSGWYERDLALIQMSGDHGLGALTFAWRGSLAHSTRDAPYERKLRRLVGDDGLPRYAQANNYSIRFTKLEDEIVGAGADLTYELPLSGPRQGSVSIGYEYSKTDRTYDLLALRFAGGNSLPPDTQIARPDFLFSPDNIDPARFVLQEITTPNDSYSAELKTQAVYAMADLELIPTVRTTFGVRYEDGQQGVRTFDRFGNFGAGTVDLNNSYWLPSAMLTWNFADNMQIRGGYSKTIARPQFRELAQSSFFDPETERIYRGNRGLVDSKLTNYDARYEYYLGRNQFLTLGGFYKTIDKPIEEVQFSTSTFVFETTFINTPKAELFGGEFEYRTRFAMPFSGEWFARRDWLFSLNYTFTASEVQAKAGDEVFDPISGTFRDATFFAVDGARLQGTPKHIMNGQFGWEGESDQLTLLVGWVSQRTLQRGFRFPGAELPDVVEDPGIQVDIVYRLGLQMLGTDFTIGLAARNLLGERHEEYQLSALGRTEFNTYDRGRSLSASLTANF